MCTCASGLTAGGQVVGTDNAASTPAKSQPAVPVINELTVPGEGMPLAEFLGYLQSREPSFQYVVSAGAYQDAVVPKMRLKNVTVLQVVEMVRRLVPAIEVTIEEPRGSSTPLWVFRQSPGAGSDASKQVSAFGLNDAVERLAMRKAWSSGLDAKAPPTPDQVAAARKEAVKEVLSLVEAALAQASERGASPTLKFHEATGVLLVKGTSSYINVISQTIEALKSGDDPDQLRVKYNRLADQLQNQRARSQDLAQRERIMQAKIADLERKLQSATSRPGDTSADKH